MIGRKRVVCIIQARMDSKRLPKKVMIRIEGRTLLAHLIERLKLSKLIDEIIVATTDDSANMPIVREAIKNKVFYYVGEEYWEGEDVLYRMTRVAIKADADIIVRVTADNIFTCPFLIDKMIRKLVKTDADMVHNKHFDGNKDVPPLGIGAEVVTARTLKRMNVWARSDRHRNNVTFYAIENPDKFKVERLYNIKYASPYRLTLDYKADLILVKRLFKALYKKGEIFSLDDIIKFLDEHPRIAKRNMHIEDRWKN